MARSRTASAPVSRPAVRCAIYTRKSTAAGLESSFNTLDNQRERAEAYIASQSDQGWTALSTRYDDGGFSGGNIERPALKQLMDDVAAGVIGTVVVYRLDRLSRSLVDFGRIHEYLEKRGVGLVSVTESINTSTPHGRMMVNVLLSFAQYERELIGERTSHKIRSARRKGKWTGGMRMPGYDPAPEGGRLEVNADESKIVVAIFEMYVANPSLVGVAQELNRRGWRRKSWTTKTGKLRRGKAWDRKTLASLLRDPIYVGLQKLGDETFKGEHRGIVPKALFNQVQRLLDGNLRDRGATARNKHGALLRGLLRCSACDAAMTFSPVKRGNRVHRYYRCSAANRHGHGSCPASNVSADQIESFVVNQIRRIGADKDLQDETFRQALAQVKAQQRGLKLDQRNLKKELDRSRADVERLTATLTRIDGSAADAVATELGKVQDELQRLESRRGEITTALAALDNLDVDRDDLARALEAFDPIWDVLLTPERERVLRLLIDSIQYDGQRLDVEWRLAGFGQLAKELT